MWTYTTYIFGKYCEKSSAATTCDNLLFRDFSKFVFNVLWRQQKLVFHDGAEDLYHDFKYLQKIGIVDLEVEGTNIDQTKIKIKDQEKLNKIVKVVEDSATLTGVKLFDEYTERINRALENKPCVAAAP